MGFPRCRGLCRSTALFKPFVMQTVLICASMHPQPVSALWSHPVLSPSYQRVPLFYMELVFSLYSLSPPRSLCHCLMPDPRMKKLRSSVNEKSHIQYFQRFLFCRFDPLGQSRFSFSCDGIWRGCLHHFSFARSFEKRNPLLLTSL